MISGFTEIPREIIVFCHDMILGLAGPGDINTCPVCKLSYKLVIQDIQPNHLGHTRIYGILIND